MLPLPIDAFLDRIASILRHHHAAIVTAEPGAGKTTRIPPSLSGDGPVILLQPRRVAARAIAARIAEERGWTLGREVGWHVRFDRRFHDDTRVLVVTEGILTARLQADPLLSAFRTVIFDEFHERSIHADVAIALAKQAWHARQSSDALRIVVMSATLETDTLAAYLGGCPAIAVPGRQFPLTIEYAPGVPAADAARRAIAETSGGVLCFLPGAAEIRQTIDALGREPPADVDVLPLYGSLDANEQDAAIRPAARRRLVVATNIAETSLTVPGITAVVDSGLHKVARYDAERGIDSLDVERIPADAAEQRAGRAGRVRPGHVWRLWSANDRLRARREPDIERIDLCGPALEVIRWGGDPRTLDWFEAPPVDALERALGLLARLGLVDGVRLTPLGERVQRLPVHPRLGRMLAAADGSIEMLRAVAILSERHFLPRRAAATTCDLFAALDDWSRVPPHVDRAARELAKVVEASGRPGRPLAEREFRRAILAGYPDRVARRRSEHSPDVKLATGTGALVGTESGVVGGEFLAAVDVSVATSSPRAPAASVVLPRIRIASIIDREWLAATDVEVVHHFDAEAGRVRATRVERYDALILSETPGRPDADLAAQLVADAWLRRGPTGPDEQLLRRLRFAGHAVDLDDLVRTAARGALALDDLRLERAVPAHVAGDLSRDAPLRLALPSGRSVALDYGEDGTVTAALKLQELFGVADTPRIGRRREPVRLSLLAPNGRPVQITSDLRSFWNSAYQDVRKELRARYPKHRWPEDPFA